MFLQWRCGRRGRTVIVIALRTLGASFAFALRTDANKFVTLELSEPFDPFKLNPSSSSSSSLSSSPESSLSSPPFNTLDPCSSSGVVAVAPGVFIITFGVVAVPSEVVVIAFGVVIVEPSPLDSSVIILGTTI
jgi:hypothetical protein